MAELDSNPLEQNNRGERDRSADKPLDIPEELRLRKPSESASALQRSRFAGMSIAEIGEHVVGSRRTVAIAAPVVTDVASGPADVTTSILSGGSMKTPEQRHRATPYEFHYVDVAFAPEERGDHWATLIARGRWSDGHEESVATPIHARARSIDDVPAVGNRAATDVAAPDPVSKAAPDAGHFDKGFEEVGDQLKGAMDFVIGRQQRAVFDVQIESGTYKKRPDPPPVWRDLVEIALVMGTSGLAAAIGKLAAPKVMGFLKEFRGDVAEKVVPNEALDLISLPKQPGLGKRVAESAAEALPTAIEDGLKHPVERAFGQGSKSQSEETDSGGGDHSKNGDINFFSAQDDALATVKFHSIAFAQHLNAAFVPILRIDRAAAISAASAIVEVITGAEDEAKTQQANATAAQFVAYRSRKSLGTEKAGSETVTKMDGARRYERLLIPSSWRGLLDVSVDVKDGKLVRVNGARMKGVSQLVADRLLSASLVSAKVPVRIVTGKDLALITRDEAGRVRIAGFQHLDPSTSAATDEAQEIDAAERIVASVLAKPLSEWGITMVQTDDGSRGADQ